MGMGTAILTRERKWAERGWHILKPSEVDPDYLCDESGHYRLAIADILCETEFNSSDQEKAWAYVQTPIGSYRPLPQARKFHRSRAPFRWNIGGNRSSKSFSLAVETVWRLIGRHPWRPDLKTPQTGWYATTTFDKLGELYRIYLKPLLTGIKHRIIWHNKAKEIPDTILVFLASGVSRLVCKAFEQKREGFELASCDFIHFDEQFAQDIFIESISRIGSSQVAEFSASMTPINSQPWLERRLSEAKRGTDDVFSFPLDDNRADWGGFIPSERILALIEQWPVEVRETRRFGKWGAFLGAIYQTFSRDTHVVSEEREQRLFLKDGKFPYGTEIFGSIDWGGSNPFVFLWVAKIPHLDDDLYVFDEYYWPPKERGGRRLQDHAEEISARNAKWGVNLVRTYADHDPTNALEFFHYGVESQPANKDVDSGIEAVRSALSPRVDLLNDDWKFGRPAIHFAERCENSIREHAGYRWKPGTDRQDAPDQPLKLNDHTCDATRYLVVGERMYIPVTAAMIDTSSFRYGADQLMK